MGHTRWPLQTRTLAYLSQHPTPTTEPTITSRQTRRTRRQYHGLTNELYHNAKLTATDDHIPQDTTQTNPDANNMKHSPQLPQLDNSNYAPCYIALESYATSIDASEYLETDPTPPIDPAQLKIQAHKNSKLLTAILGTVPSSVLGLIFVPGEKPTP